MIYLLFENRWALAAVWVIVQFALLVMWARRRTARSRWALLAGFVSGPMLIAVSTWIQTPRERIREMCAALALAVQQEDTVTIAEFLAPEFTEHGLSREEFLARIQTGLKRYDIRSPVLSSFKIVFSGDGRSVAEFRSGCFVEAIDGYSGYVPLAWRLTLLEQRKSWRVLKIECIPIPPLRIVTLERLLH